MADMIRAALTEFAQDIEAAGGVRREDDGLAVPVGDPEWVDLGETYLRACAALGRKPLYQKEEP
jgi:hypothetical protein